MPELPEIETVKRSIEPMLLHAHVVKVDLRRRDIAWSPRGSVSPRDLLHDDVVSAIMRRGKQLAIVGHSGRVLVVQLGMSGQFFSATREAILAQNHVHCVWTIQGEKGPPALIAFRDPRRFGGLSCLASIEDLEREQWGKLGPDALTIEGNVLVDAAHGSSRSIKSILLDQSVLAGVGNIYADESLFRAGLRPSRRAGRHTRGDLMNLAAKVRSVLSSAVRARGSTLRDYRDGLGNEGSNQHLLNVYGRAGENCLLCGTPLSSGLVAQRTTVWCRMCQR